ncbi:hypothetical protein [Vibrio parahaemolyticus]|uniref:hypothetical protein n=1 Tax=Vibrio parahaemolyticus TaxID=670 RepID=UPI0017811475|nr:hypothetical protein [Vibrio parahaemolyticus]MBD6945048.1 hypothetical protein [Vibrio parahaemolyticus]MBD6978946.1 hypothetical protein [Vibrio parahaemolyticus]MBD6990951.1 hypothetical protein [Vibrio parahaemolyticus]WOZ62912.1 hypothetical protein RHS38_26205 [Vibrio parahaemolyticus]
MKLKHWLPSINVKQLDYAYHVAKRLDEHRELIENIEKATGFFSLPEHSSYREIAKAQDDYLLHLYELRMGHSVVECPHPSKFTAQFPYVRPRPRCLSKTQWTPRKIPNESTLIRILKVIGWIPDANIQPKLLGNVAERLNAHRRLIDAVDKNTNFFRGEYFWSESHARCQDDYFQYLYQLKHGQWYEEQKTTSDIHSRPNIFKASRLKKTF